MNKQNRIWAQNMAIAIAVCFAQPAVAQCPPNIGFESGSLANWECSKGTIDIQGHINLFSNGPDPERHKLIKNTNPQVLDKYGGFPVNSPNGSGYSIRLGDLANGKGAEQVSYTFTIPADKNTYSIIYNYAVVLQNPNHADYQQPKFTAKVFDVNGNSYVGCSSFEFIASSGLPGFEVSRIDPSIVYKPWSPITIKLVGMAGATMRIEFTTNDCTQGGHLGYAYIDVDENCSSPVTGSTSCPTDSLLTLTAPFGFKGYKWYTSDFSTLLGTANVLVRNPVPPPNTVYAVEITPFPNQGCLDTVYATVRYSGDIVDLQVATPVNACVPNGVNLSNGLVTRGSSPGLIYTYYTDSLLKSHLFGPDLVTANGTYYIKAINPDGCIAVKPVTVRVNPLPSFSVLTKPQPIIRPATLNLSTIISGGAGASFSYWKDSLTTIPVDRPDAVDKGGSFYIKGTTAEGCSSALSVTVISIDPAISLPNTFSPNGDGVNDNWEIPMLKLYPDCIVEIYNRAGQIMFRSAGYNTPWDGKQGGYPVPVGTYYYMIKPSREQPAIGGSITVIR